MHQRYIFGFREILPIQSEHFEHNGFDRVMSMLMLMMRKWCCVGGVVISSPLRGNSVFAANHRYHLILTTQHPILTLIVQYPQLLPTTEPPNSNYPTSNTHTEYNTHNLYQLPSIRCCTICDTMIIGDKCLASQRTFSPIIETCTALQTKYFFANFANGIRSTIVVDISIQQFRIYSVSNTSW